MLDAIKIGIHAHMLATLCEKHKYWRHLEHFVLVHI